MKNLKMPETDQKEMDKKDKSSAQKILQRSGCSIWSSLFWLLITIGFAFWAFGDSNILGGPTMISYSEFRQQVQDGNVTTVTVQGEQISGTFDEPVKQTADEQTITVDQFTTVIPSFGDDELLNLLETNDVTVETRAVQNFSWINILFSLLPFILLGAVGYFFISRMRSQGSNIMSIGKSKARLYDKRQEVVTFEDVAGTHGAKNELEEIIEFLRAPSRFEKLGGEIPRGVLLVGPPGTGKTLLARAVAGEADVPFFNITGSDFMEMFVGVGASRVRDLFEDAKKASPSIIFIDELDSIGRTRGAGLGGGHDEREQTLNQLLSEMDGFEPNTDVIIMAATNRPDILDPALLRPGRFDRRITVDLPTMKDRVEILKIHSRNKPLAPDIDLERIARGTPGFSGADLENLLNEAALLAARQDKDAIELADFENARDKIMLGLERANMALSEDECELIAYHEGGHALVAVFAPHADPIHKVTIVPRGKAMGVTQQLPEKEKYIYPREYILDRLAVMMGGRAAEEMVLDTNTSGAENDLKQATNLARKMILDWGMGENLKQVAFGGESQQVFLGEELSHRRKYSETTAREIDEEVKKILSDAYERARQILDEHRDELDQLVGVLIEKEEISGEEVLELLDVDREEVAEKVKV
ncbi:MAG: ATP-dependent zinc metalloprotease FtsH [Anaerolineales bacterium]|jgi:cell division protease FtsH